MPTSSFGKRLSEVLNDTSRTQPFREAYESAVQVARSIEEAVVGAGRPKKKGKKLSVDVMPGFPTALGAAVRQIGALRTSRS